MGDGLLFVHKDHPLSDIIRQGATKKKALGDAARWGGFTGEVFPPRVRDITGEGEELVPPSSSPGAEDISDGVETNFAVVAAYTEPEKRPHLSVILPGAVLPPAKVRSCEEHGERSYDLDTYCYFIRYL